MVFRIGNIHIIQALDPDDDRPTGWELYQHILPLVPRPSPLEVFYQSVSTRNELFRALSVIAEQSMATSRPPLLHFETHGSTEGLHLASREMVTWRELHPYLVRLNQITCVNLVVMAMACEGLDLLKAFDYAKRAPAGLVIGPQRVVWDNELSAGTRAFYASLFATLSASAAQRAMNDAVNALPAAVRGDESPFVGMDAERLFRWVMQGYAEQYTGGAALEGRIDRLSRRLVARFVRERGLLAEQVEPIVRAQVTAYLTNHRPIFEGLRHHFFFIDLCPENDARFNVRFEDCFPQG